jgi:hypothetical protein
MTAAELRQEAREIADRRPDAIQVWTLDERRTFLVEVAEQVAIERRRNDQIKPYSAAMAGPDLLPNIAAVSCGEPYVAFERLVDAVDELRAYNADPVGYTQGHGLFPADADRVGWQREQAVEDAVSALLGGAE